VSESSQQLSRVADRVMDYLVSIDVTDVFTVSGGGAIFLDDALAKEDRLRYHCCHHEQAVAMATEAYARVKGDIGVSLVTTGPGGTNAITGVGGSWMDSVPHLVISGQVFRSQTIGASGLRQLGVQEINIIDIVKPMVKYAVMIEDVKKTLYHLQKAVYLAKSGRPGPVWIDIPADIQNARIAEEDYEIFDPAELADEVPNEPIDEAVEKVAQLLQEARRPLLHLGQGVQLAGALDGFMRLAEEKGIPFVTARNANELVDWDHDLYVGRPGTFAQRGANFAVQNSDVYIAIGTRLSLPQTGYNAKDYARNAFKVMVDIDRAELDKPTLQLDLKIQADAGRFIAALNKRLGEEGLAVESWRAQCRDWKSSYPVIPAEFKAQDRYVNSYHFIDVLSNILEADDIVVTDMGLAFQGTHQAFRVKKGQRLLTNSGFASMGWGLPAAVGACVAHGGKRVVCIAGDGGLQMTIQELATVMHYQLPVKIFVYNNGGYLTIKQSQEIGFDGRLMGCNAKSGLSFPDFAQVAQGYRIAACKIDCHEGLQEKLREILDDGEPMLCELIMDPDQEQVPKAIPRKMPDGSTQQTVFEDMFPFLDRDELAQNMIAEKEEVAES